MVNEVQVRPTPIQRNAYDLATDLTSLYYQQHTPQSVEEVQETFVKLFSTATIV